MFVIHRRGVVLFRGTDFGFVASAATIDLCLYKAPSLYVCMCVYIRKGAHCTLAGYLFSLRTRGDATRSGAVALSLGLCAGIRASDNHPAASDGTDKARSPSEGGPCFSRAFVLFSFLTVKCSSTRASSFTFHYSYIFDVKLFNG